MLCSISIKNFTLVEALEIDFQAGLTAITGETGAGKSLVLNALCLALGDRADTGQIRQGADKLEVSAHFRLPNKKKAQAEARNWLQNNDYDTDDECLLRRIVTREGRSRGYINGQPAAMQQLQQLGELLIDIHSQHEHQSLLKRDTHRRLLDEFAEQVAQATAVANAYQTWHRAAEKLTARESQSDEIAARRELLQFQVQELDQLALEDNELAALEQEQQLLANAEDILRGSHSALALCQSTEDGPDLLSGLSRALQLLQGMPQQNKATEEALGLLDTARIQVEEAAHTLQLHIDSFDLDPERLQIVEDRLSTVYQMARKHRVQPEELAGLHQHLSAELAELVCGSGDLDSLKQQVQMLEQDYQNKAKALSAARQKAAKAFAKAVNEQLASLAMADANLQVELTPLAKGRYSSQGLETVEFRVSTNPGQPHKALAKTASGGELSRISLTIQVVAARHSSIPTLVFDEVDAGIGGNTGTVVGRLLRALGESGQVICVTHLPQVASCAHHHLLAEKTRSADATESRLIPLKKKDRTEEIARMLGGEALTDRSLAHAREMLGV